WENEAFLALNELGPDQLEIVVPSVSVLAEPPVVVVEGNTEPKGKTDLARAYLEYLYSAEGQGIAARNYYRPRYPELVAAEDLDWRSEVELFTVREVFGSWAEAQATHFAD